MANEPNYGKDQVPFSYIGVSLASAVDNCPPGLAPILENWRPEIDGTLSIRPGLGTGREIVAGQSPAHSVMRLEDSSSGSISAVEIVGTGTHVATCATDLSTSASRDSGYSGDPLAILSHQPVESLKAWAYVADRSRMRKFDVSGNRKKIGITAPTGPPTPKIDVPRYKTVDEMNSAAAWTQGGTAAAPSNNTRIDGATRTVTRFLFDSGTTGWACVRPSSMADVGVGTRLTVDSGGSLETVTVEQVFRGAAVTTIAAIIYQSGAGSGLCSIHLTTPLLEIEPDSMVLLDNGAGTTEYVRVIAVTKTPEGLSSIVCSTTNTFAAGHSATIVASFRAYFTITHANGVAMSAAGVEFTATVGKGWISQTIALDLSFIASGVPTQLDDLMHVDLYADDPSVVNEVRVMLDIDSATNDFSENYLFRAIRPEDITAAVALDQTVLSNRQVQAQRELAEEGLQRIEDAFTDVGRTRSPGANINVERIITNENTRAEDKHIAAGSNQWASVTFRVSELLDQSVGRVGSDQSRGLANVAALRILVWCTASVTIRVDSWWIGGGYGPEVGVSGRSLIYRYRGHDTSTGVVGNFSPPSRVSVRPNRQRVLVDATVHPDTEVDVLDFERWGGVLLGWYYVGSVPNSGSPQLSDAISPFELKDRQVLSEGNTHYELWPIRSTPITGGSCNVAGSLVQCLGFTQIPTTLAPGNEVRIGGKDYTLGQIIDADTFWILESGGAQTAVSLEIVDPIIIGQPLPILAGPHYNFYFGAGDRLNPQRIYYTNGNDCDSTQDTHHFDIPGENIQQIVMIPGHAIVFGVKGIYSIEPQFTLADSGGDLFRWESVTCEVPIFGRWSVCSDGTSLIYLGRDGGLYQTAGGPARFLSGDLRPLFPHEGSLGVAVNGFQPPNVVAAQLPSLRLSHAAAEIFFDYIDTASGRRTLVWSRHSQSMGWRPYSYSVGAILHYSESGENVNSVLVGGADGKLYRLGRAQADAAGASITATIRTPSLSFGDDTNQKLFKEIRVSYDTDGATLTLTPGFDNYATTIAASTLNEASGRRMRVIDVDSGRGQLAFNLALNIAATVTTQRPTLYFWSSVRSPRADTTNLRTPDWSVGPHPINFVRGLYIHADTFNTSRAADFEYLDDSGVVASVAITGIDHDQLTRRYYPLATPVYACSHRVRPTDAGSWQFLGYDLDADPAPPLTTAQTDKIDLGGARFVHGITVDIDTAAANVNLTVKGDGETTNGDTTLATISSGNNSGPASSTGRAQLSFSFEVPFITNILYLTRSAACRIWGVKVHQNPEPELAYMWKSQQTACGIPGWKVFGDGYISVRSTESIRFFIIADGTSHEVTFRDASTNTSGNRRRLFFRCPPIKAKSVEFMAHTLTEAGRVAIYESDFTLEIRPWSHEGSWLPIHPLGDRHHETGAPI